MRHVISIFIPILLLGCLGFEWLYAEEIAPMSETYYAFWNDQVQAKIDADIEKNRKADVAVSLEGVSPETEIQVVQLSHAFRFGGNTFLFGQLNTPEKNQAYAATFGDLFNSGTVAFYWKTLEPEPGKPRFLPAEHDTPEFWATVAEPKREPHWRRPPTDPVVQYLESRGLFIHGHAILYGMRRWGHPEWLPNDRKAMEPYFEQHVRQLAERYQGRILEWDVVNECIDQANRGLMPDDYVYKTFRWAERYFPSSVRLSSNECDMAWGPNRRYVEIVRDLRERGVRVDLMGVQMHIFDQQLSQRLADGANSHTPAKMWAVLDTMSEAELPIHISEVTISAPSDTPQGRAIQAVLARNLYRLWFSYPQVAGITWWNLVDGGSAPGEPAISGIFTADLQKKPVYDALDSLINKEWRTNLTVHPAPDGTVSFRGFRGKYRLSWVDANGSPQSHEIDVR